MAYQQGGLLAGALNNTGQKFGGGAPFNPANIPGWYPGKPINPDPGFSPNSQMPGALGGGPSASIGNEFAQMLPGQQPGGQIIGTGQVNNIDPGHLQQPHPQAGPQTGPVRTAPGEYRMPNGQIVRPPGGVMPQQQQPMWGGGDPIEHKNGGGWIAKGTPQPPMWGNVRPPKGSNHINPIGTTNRLPGGKIIPR